MKTQLIMEIETERDDQDEQWGGPDHDDDHDENDWVKYIRKQIDKKDERFRERMIKVAALAVAAIESYDRINR